MSKTYSSRSNAKRAAVAALGTHALEGADYRLVETDGRWGWATGGPATIAEPEAPDEASSDAPDIKADMAATEPRRREGTKQARLIEMLQRPEGASISEIVAEFGWQPHTARGAIAGGRAEEEARPHRYLGEDRDEGPGLPDRGVIQPFSERLPAGVTA